MSKPADEWRECPECGSKKIQRIGLERVEVIEEFDAEGFTLSAEHVDSHGFVGLVECECQECNHMWCVFAEDRIAGQEELKAIYEDLCRSIWGLEQANNVAPAYGLLCRCRDKLREFSVLVSSEDGKTEEEGPVVGSLVGSETALEVIRAGGEVSVKGGLSYRWDQKDDCPLYLSGSGWARSHRGDLRIAEYRIVDTGGWSESCEQKVEPVKVQSVEKQLTLIEE